VERENTNQWHDHDRRSGDFCVRELVQCKLSGHVPNPIERQANQNAVERRDRFADALVHRRNQPNQEERDQVKQRPDQRRQGKRNAVYLECEAPKQSRAGILKHRRVDPHSRLAKRALFLLRRLSKRGGLAQRLGDDLLLDGRVPARRQPVIKHGAAALIAALVPNT